MTLRIFEPRTRPPREFRIFGWDIEDNGHGDFVGVSIFDPENGKACDFQNRRAFMAELKRRKYRESLFIAHNAEYDIGGIFGKKHLDRFSRYVTVGGQFKTARLPVSGGKSITFIDLHSHIKSSLERIGKQIDLPKGTDPGLDAPWSVRRPYCIRDAEIAARAAVLLQSQYLSIGTSLRATVGSSAMELFQRRYLKISWSAAPRSYIDWCYGGYYGGKTEAYRIGYAEGPFNYYDKNSLYPTAMASAILPHPGFLRFKANPRPSCLDYEGISDVLISVPRDTKFPVMGLKVGKRLTFPVGSWRGKYPNSAIRYGISVGKCRILKIYSTYSSLISGAYLADYANDLYAKRQEATGYNREVIKSLLNNLYGKWAQRGRPTVWKDGAWIKEDSPAPVWTCVPWSAYVTSGGHALMDPCYTDDTVYTDTDSNITKGEMVTGAGLGDMKLEGRYDAILIITSKVYGLLSDNSPAIYHAKGFPIASARAAVLAGGATFRAPNRLRESMRRNLKVNEWLPHTKVLKTNYAKRIIFPDGSTAPLVINKPH